jgi:hypothetical protein
MSTTPDIRAALAAARADQERATQRIADLQAQLDKPKPFVRALDTFDTKEHFFSPGSGPGDSVARIYSKDCHAQGIDPAEFANAVRLSMCMADFVRRWNVDDGSAELTNLGCWLARELGDCESTNGPENIAAARKAGWID